MKILIYNTKDFERSFLLEANKDNHRTDITSVPLTMDTVKMANGYSIVSVFTGDNVSANVLQQLHQYGIKYITVRSAVCDNVDIIAAEKLGIRIANVPPYSPYAIAEHTVALILALNRKLIKADRQVREYNFSIDNLIGFDLHQKTVGIIGMGRIGRTVARILDGFGCRLLGYDIAPDPDLSEALSITYTDLDTLCSEADIISLHVPLTHQTRHLINRQRIARMKKGVMLINTSRGAVINTADVLKALEQGAIGYFGADVYELEHDLYFHDYRENPIKSDPMLNRFLEMPNVLITPHQSFASRETLTQIAEASFYNIGCFINNLVSKNELTRTQWESAT